MAALKVRFRVQGLGFRQVGAIGAVLSRFLLLLQKNLCLPHSGLSSMRPGDLWIRAGEDECLFQGLLALWFISDVCRQTSHAHARTCTHTLA
jgi:hypothetical protein